MTKTLIKREMLIERNISGLQTDCICPFCKKGFMKFTGRQRQPVIMLRNKAKQMLKIHICSNCSKEKTFERIFPQIKIKPNIEKEIKKEEEVINNGTSEKERIPKTH